MSESNKQTVYSVCAMCTVRCPIEVEVENGDSKTYLGQSTSSWRSLPLSQRGRGESIPERQRTTPAPHDPKRRERFGKVEESKLG